MTRLIFLSLCALSLLGCYGWPDRPSAGVAVSEKVSPNGISKAFVWAPQQGGLGATVSQPLQVWINHGGRGMVFEGDKSNGLRIRWLSDSTLEICYSRMQITKFRNEFVDVNEGSPEIYSIEVVLRKVESLDSC